MYFKKSNQSIFIIELTDLINNFKYINYANYKVSDILLYRV